MVGPRKRLARQVASPGAEPAAPVPPSVSGAAARAARKRRVLLAVTGVLVASLLLQVALHCAAPRPTGKERRSGRTFGEFWPFYLAHLRQHDNPHNRALHVVGTTMALFLGIFQPGGRSDRARERTRSRRAAAPVPAAGARIPLPAGPICALLRAPCLAS